jgi:L-asparaginase II
MTHAIVHEHAADGVPRTTNGPVPEHDVVLAEVIRDGFTESVHRGTLVALDAHGAVVLALGEIERPILPRSSNKPMQATGMVRAGLGLRDELLALASASHAGESFHIDGVRRILAGAGLGEAALGNAVGLPLDDESRAAVFRNGDGPSRLLMNCSGKHSAMLATCVAAGWPVEGYLDAAHPLQLALRGEVERLAGEPVAAVAVDGCGAPLFGISTLGLARAFRGCVTAAPDAPERRVADAMRAYPAFVAGTHRLDTRLMRDVPGAMAKGGAEGVQAVALGDGGVVAFKMSDGANRAHGPVAAAALARLGVDAELLRGVAQAPVLGGGADHGAIHAAF